MIKKKFRQEDENMALKLTRKPPEGRTRPAAPAVASRPAPEVPHNPRQVRRPVPGFRRVRQSTEADTGMPVPGAAPEPQASGPQTTGRMTISLDDVDAKIPY
ncbi:hypothetical protein LDL36_17130 [Komagataeibacter sp. FNDCR1]|nr:hypothetical protein [Komagataeibacter sp. FNDCR1]